MKSLGQMNKKKKIKLNVLSVMNDVAIVFNVFVYNMHHCNFVELKWSEK